MTPEPWSPRHSATRLRFAFGKALKRRLLEHESSDVFGAPGARPAPGRTSLRPAKAAPQR